MARWFKKKTVVSFLVSGSGLNFQAVAKEIFRGAITARIGAVVTDNHSARVQERAGVMGVPVHVADPASPPDEFDETLLRTLERYKTDLVVAAGFLRILSPRVVNRYRNRIINIHPSLLPSFPGVRSQGLALDYGVKVTGCTTHFIDEGIDTGPIIMQAPVPVLDDDTVETLSARILKEEYRILAETVRLFCEGRLEVVENRVVVR